VLAAYAEVGAKSGHVAVTRMKSWAMCYELVSPCRQRGMDGQRPRGDSRWGQAWHPHTARLRSCGFSASSGRMRTSSIRSH